MPSTSWGYTAYGFDVEDEHLVEVYDLLYFCASLESEDILDPSVTEGHFKVRQVYRREDSLVEVYFKDKKKNSLGAITINYYLTEEEERFVEQNPCVTPPFILERFKDMIGTDNWSRIHIKIIDDMHDTCSQ